MLLWPKPGTSLESFAAPIGWGKKYAVHHPLVERAGYSSTAWPGIVLGQPILLPTDTRWKVTQDYQEKRHARTRVSGFRFF